MLKTVFIVIVVVALGLLGYAATRPDSFRVERSIRIPAPIDKVFALLQDFHHWPQWSPWEKLDPAMKRMHSGAPAGKGAVYAWVGNGQVGEGRMEIVDLAAPNKLVVKLDFIKPFESHSMAEFTLTPDGNATRLSWAMYGPANFMVKLMGVFVSMDAMVGKDFEAGLANLKAAAEKS